MPKEKSGSRRNIVFEEKPGLREKSVLKEKVISEESSAAGESFVSEENSASGESFVSKEKPVLEEIRISVRSLVEFVLRHGDIDNRHKASPDNAMQESSRIHRMIQRRMGAGYQAEVSLKYTQENDRYLLVVEGRADGILREEGKVTIDEIK